MRKPRILQENGRYHVVARANHREFLLESESVKALFLRTVARAKAKFAFRVENFTILGNHVHMIVHTPPGSSLSQIMKWILGVFAMAWNRIHGNWGHFWGERFYSHILGTFEAYRNAFRYVTENPVQAGLVRSAEEWEFGGLCHYLRKSFFVLDSVPSELAQALWGRA